MEAAAAAAAARRLAVLAGGWALLQSARVTVLLHSGWLPGQSPLADSDACPWSGVLPLAIMVPVTMSTGSANAYTAPLH